MFLCVVTASTASTIVAGMAHLGAADQAGTSASGGGEPLLALVLFDYTAQATDEVTLRRGIVVHVVQRGMGGDWTVVEREDCERGCVPTDFLKFKAAGSARQNK